jgi:hypothetical protein
MTDSQKLYYCACIRSNRYRYSYGRQANKTLRELPIPALDDIPDWVNNGINRIISDFSNRLQIISGAQ